MEDATANNRPSGDQFASFTMPLPQRGSWPTRPGFSGEMLERPAGSRGASVCVQAGVGVWVCVGESVEERVGTRELAFVGMRIDGEAVCEGSGVRAGAQAKRLMKVKAKNRLVRGLNFMAAPRTNFPI